MDSRNRKLLFMPEHDPSAPSSPAPHSGASSNTSSSLDQHDRHKTHEQYSYYSNGATSGSYGGFSSYRLNPPFDSSMALTVLVLLTALFFMGFFSIYIRRFADDSSVDPSRFLRRRRRRRPPSLSSYTAAARSAGKGVDPDMVDSLPVYSYDGGAKAGVAAELECAICLSEFEEGEYVKVIPFCGHVFHVGCIEAWLAAHVTCPLCRTAKLFPEKSAPAAVEGSGLAPAEVRVAIGCGTGGAEPVGGLGSTVDERDTWNQEGEGVGPSGLRRSSSFSWRSERVRLRRSLSF